MSTTEIAPPVADIVPDLANGTRPLGLAASAFEKPRRFALHRSDDPDGTTGVGLVCWGVIWPSGRVALDWTTLHAMRGGYYDSIEDVIALHGRATATEFLDF